MWSLYRLKEGFSGEIVSFIDGVTIYSQWWVVH